MPCIDCALSNNCRAERRQFKDIRIRGVEYRHFLDKLLESKETLIYSRRMRNLAGKKPEVLGFIAKAVDGKEMFFEEKGMRAFKIEDPYAWSNEAAYRIEVEGKKYFLKKTPTGSWGKNAVLEFLALLDMKRFHTEHVVPIRALAAYSDSRSNYIVTQYHEPHHPLETMPNEIFSELIGDMASKCMGARVHDPNIDFIYNKKKNIAYIFDPWNTKCTIENAQLLLKLIKSRKYLVQTTITQEDLDYSRFLEK